MFKNLNGKTGWCDFELGGAKGCGSWAGNGALDFVEAFIDRLQDKSRLSLELDGEGIRTALVETTTRTFVIQWRDDDSPRSGRPKLFDVSERSLKDLTYELLRDVEPELEEWAVFLGHGYAKNRTWPPFRVASPFSGNSRNTAGAGPTRRRMASGMIPSSGIALAGSFSENDRIPDGNFGEPKAPCSRRKAGNGPTPPISFGGFRTCVGCIPRSVL